MRRTRSGCCARADTGQTAAPPITVMNTRRFICGQSNTLKCVGVRYGSKAERLRLTKYCPVCPRKRTPVCPRRPCPGRHARPTQLRKVVAYYGTYTVDEANKTINLKFEGISFAKFVGTEGKRVITSIDDNEFRSANPATSTGTKAESVWRRMK
jgi:hypothetical protein